MKKLVCLLLAVLLVLGACACAAKDQTTASDTTDQPAAQEPADTADNADETATADVDPLGKYDTPVEITTTMNEDNIRNVESSQTMDSNVWHDLFAEYGINVSYKFSGSASDLETKINMAIATDDLPDVMSVTATQFADLTDTDMLADLTDVFETYASDKLKAKLYADGGVMMSNGYVDGKLYAIVLPIAYYDYIPVVSIRSDWLEECGLEAPKTMDDLWNIAKTFKDNNMGGTCTIGIGMTKNVTDVLTAGVGLLNGYHAYSNIWLEKDGELVNSNIQPEMKAALGALAEKYSEGLIDPEFGTKENAQIVEDVMAGRCGIVVSNFCAPFDLANAAADGQQWSFYAVPSVDGEPVLAQESANFTGGVVVSAKCEHPEAVIKLFNLFAEYEFDEKTGNNAAGLRNFAYPFVVDDINANYKIHYEYLQFLETGKTPETVTAGYDSTVEACEKYNKDGNMEGWSMYAIFGPDSTEALVNAAVEANGYLVSAYTGSSTESMLNYDSTLKTLTEQFITDVIRGVKTVDDFDDYVASWKANGGDKITEEVNAWYTAQ